MTAQFLKEKEEIEIKGKDFGVNDFNGNQLETEKKKDRKRTDLETKIADYEEIATNQRFVQMILNKVRDRREKADLLQKGQEPSDAHATTLATIQRPSPSTRRTTRVPWRFP